MVGRGQVRLKKVWAMLDECAPGYTRKKFTHNWSVAFDGKIYRRLPLGAHGRRQNAEIEIGHVKNMVRFLAIDACKPAPASPRSPLPRLSVACPAHPSVHRRR